MDEDICVRSQWAVSGVKICAKPVSKPATHQRTREEGKWVKNYRIWHKFESEGRFGMPTELISGNLFRFRIVISVCMCGGEENKLLYFGKLTAT